MNMTRTPAGNPAGGEYAAHARPEADATLKADMSSYRTSAPGLMRLTPATQRVLAAIRAAGGTPLIVGGSVRDALLAVNREAVVYPKDIDIEAYGVQDKNRLLAELARVGRVDERGVSFGVIAVAVRGEDFDVSLPRRDSKNGDGHTGFDVETDQDLDEVTAFGRRDFTVNALGFDPQVQELIDPYGGQADLAAGVLRHTSVAFADDPLRVLRGVSFAARFGFTMAGETAELCASIADKYGDLSTMRIWGEWQKIACRGTNISAALTVLADTGWIRHYPELDSLRGLTQSPAWHPEGDVYTHAGLSADSAARTGDANGWDGLARQVAVLGALTHDLGKATHTRRDAETGKITAHGHAEAGVALTESFLERIGAPRRLIGLITPIVREHMCHTSFTGAPSATAVRRLIRRLNPKGTGPSILDWAHVVDADHNGRGSGNKPSPTGAWLDAAKNIGTTPLRGLLRGEHLIAAGMVPGREFAPILAAAVEAQDDGLFDDEAGAIAWFQNYRR